MAPPSSKLTSSQTHSDRRPECTMAANQHSMTSAVNRTIYKNVIAKNSQKAKTVTCC